MPAARETRQSHKADPLQLGSSNVKPVSQAKVNQTATKPVVMASEVIEISDSDDDVPAPSLKRKTSLVSTLERDVKKLKQENQARKTEEKNLKAELVRLQKTMEKTREEKDSYQSQVKLLQSQISTNTKPSKSHLPISEVEDSVTCEICTIKMWTPYILECGHTYCQSCLQDWFSTTLAQHMQKYPNYTLNHPQPQMHYGIDMYNQHYAHLLGATMPQPNYTCPTCREQVRNPPVEDFNLKAIVRAVASVQGESSPRKDVGSSGRRKNGKAAAAAAREDPWSGFFRKRQKA